MTLTHCPEGERLYKEYCAAADNAEVAFTETMEQAEARAMAATRWHEYRAHRSACEKCGTKDD